MDGLDDSLLIYAWIFHFQTVYAKFVEPVHDYYTKLKIR